MPFEGGLPLSTPSARRAAARPERSSAAVPRHLVQLPLPLMLRVIARFAPIIAGSRPSAGDINARPEFELVVVRLGVEVECDPVTAIVEESLHLDQCAARAYVRLGP